MQKKALVFIVIFLVLVFALFLVQNTKNPQIVEITPPQKIIRDDTTQEEYEEVDVTPEELGYVFEDNMSEETNEVGKEFVDEAEKVTEDIYNETEKIQDDIDDAIDGISETYENTKQRIIEE